MKTFSPEQMDIVDLNESGILSFSWINQEKDLEILIDWCGQEEFKNEIDFNNITTKLYFEHISNIDFQFKHNDTWTIGALEITEFAFKKESDSYFIEFLFDFQPVGHVRFHCYDFRFIIEKKSS